MQPTIARQNKRSPILPRSFPYPKGYTKELATINPTISLPNQAILLGIQLLDQTTTRKVQWGSSITTGHQIGVLILNRNARRMKVIAHISNQANQRITESISFLDSQIPAMFCSFTVPPVGQGPLTFSFMATMIPPMEGQGVFFVRLFAGITPSRIEEMVKK